MYFRLIIINPLTEYLHNHLPSTILLPVLAQRHKSSQCPGYHILKKTVINNKKIAHICLSTPYPWRHLVTVWSSPSLLGGVGYLRLRVRTLIKHFTAWRWIWVLGTKMVMSKFGRRVTEGMGSRDRGNIVLERCQMGPLYLTRKQNIKHSMRSV